MSVQNADTQIISRKRVADHGEVFTAEREVNAMLDLVAHETERIESRFLEPACGKGVFLAEVLNRKLAVVTKRYAVSQSEHEYASIIALSSIYGIDILHDNVQDCRNQLLGIFTETYKKIFKTAIPPEFADSAKYILAKNIIWGDALTLKHIDTNTPIIFCEWSPVNTKAFKRRDFAFGELLQYSTEGLSLFSDAGEDVFIPTPVKEFPVAHYLRLAYD